MNIKDKDEPSDRQEAVYNIKCCDRQATYTGETDRNLDIRLTEHKQATRRGDINNRINENHLQTNHTESTGTLLNALPTLRTTFNESLWKASLLTKNKHH